MKSEQGEVWKKVWERKGNLSNEIVRPISIWDLVVMNGYDSGADGITIEHWEQWIKQIKNEIPKYFNVRSWLDVGCGSGAFIYSLDEIIDIYGIDYSESLIQRAREFLRPRGNPATLYVDDLRNENLFIPETDIISCVSSLQYVPEEVGLKQFSQFLKRAKMGVLIAEIPCKMLMESGKKFRQNNLTYEVGDEYTHTYYSIHNFNQIALKNGFKPIKIKSKLGLQSSYRWSVYFEKVLSY